MKSTSNKISNLIQSKRTNYNRSLQHQQQHQKKHLLTQQKYLQTSTRSFTKNSNYYHQQQQSHISYNNNNSIMNDNNRKKFDNQTDQSIEQIIDTLKLYIKSAYDLKKYLHMPKNNTLNLQHQQQQQFNYAKNNNKSPIMLTNKNIKSRVRNKQQQTKNNNKYTQRLSSSSQQLILIITKLNMFITITQSQLQKLHYTIQRSSLNQLNSICKNNYHILLYTKQKYSQLLKQTYRMLNIQSLFSQNHQLLTQQDLLIVKQNQKRKLGQIKQIQRQLEEVWNYNKSTRNRQDKMFKRTTNYDNYDEQKQNNSYNQGQQSLSSPQYRLQSMLIKFDSSTSSNPRMLQMLIPPISKSNKNNFQQQQQQTQLNLRQLAREQLQKQFLEIRINAYNMYQKYISHQHKQFNQRLQFVKQEQQILQSQLNQQIELSQQIAQEYHRLRREIDQIKTINQLIKKRYVLRESMRIDSQSSLYNNQ